jgi:DNA repair exonuclease SbcCD ATPase subunit
MTATKRTRAQLEEQLATRDRELEGAWAELKKVREQLTERQASLQLCSGQLSHVRSELVDRKKKLDAEDERARKIEDHAMRAFHHLGGGMIQGGSGFGGQRPEWWEDLERFARQAPHALKSGELELEQERKRHAVSRMSVRDQYAQAFIAGAAPTVSSLPPESSERRWMNDFAVTALAFADEMMRLRVGVEP